MKSEYRDACKLPVKRTGTRVKLLADASIARIIIAGLLIYLVVVVAFSIVEVISQYYGRPLVFCQGGTGTRPDLWQIIYFNFVTILTIGYGDCTPNGFGKVLAVSEAILGIGVVGVAIAALTAKFLSPPRNSVVFSRYAYYSTEDECFLIIFVNTTKGLLINAEMSSFFKLGGDWCVGPAIRSPFITQAVQTFFLNKVPIDQLVRKLRDGDALRFSVEGQVAQTTFSTAIQYAPEEIIVLPNRDELTAYPGFWDFDFTSQESIMMFHHRPPNAPTLRERIDQVRRPSS